VILRGILKLAYYTLYGSFLTGKILTLKEKNKTILLASDSLAGVNIMVTILYAGILGLIYFVLSAYTVLGRLKYKVNMGDGGNESMMKRMRVHANFIEYVPFALLLMTLAEFEGVPENYIHALGISLIIGRLLHPIGLTFTFGPSFCRTSGMILTFGVLVVASILCIKSYFIL
jgi:uncharacterized membrane protein YecN with MAPEG domain